MTHELRVERVIDAEPEAVFDAFTEPGGQVAFYQGPVPGWIGHIKQVVPGPHGYARVAARSGAGQCC